jgi:molybdate transport system substrate-binding protein
MAGSTSGNWIAQLALALAVLLAAAPRPGTAGDGDLLVFAAASLKPALDGLLAQSPQAATLPVRASYAATPQLARQVEAGAPANLVLFADQAWMDWLGARGLIVSATRVDLLGNALVLVAPRASRAELTLAPRVALAAALGDGRLAVAQTGSVPAGRYAREALVRLGVWDEVATRLLPAADVRAALTFVARGEAPLGIVYRSDAWAEATVRLVATFPETSHAPIVYPAAIVQGHDSAAARALLAWLQEPAQQAAFRARGFDAPPR